MSTQNETKNIGGDPSDLHYRYKHAVIRADYIDKKGGLTKLTNINTIVLRHLHMPAAFTTAFYKQVKKMGHAMHQEGVFRGRISVTVLENILEKMIKKFVLCPACGSPEWTAGPKCPACGHATKSTCKTRLRK